MNNLSDFSCPGGAGGSLTACNEGTYNPSAGQSSSGACQACGTNEISGAGSSACTTCPAGYSCSQPNTQTACTSGEYSVSGDMSCQTCPTGSICTSTSSSPQVCSCLAKGVDLAPIDQLDNKIEERLWCSG